MNRIILLFLFLFIIVSYPLCVWRINVFINPRQTADREG